MRQQTGTNAVVAAVWWGGRTGGRPDVQAKEQFAGRTWREVRGGKGAKHEASIGYSSSGYKFIREVTTAQGSDERRQLTILAGRTR